jgi:hypothetical protein
MLAAEEYASVKAAGILLRLFDVEYRDMFLRNVSYIRRYIMEVNTLLKIKSEWSYSPTFA